MSLWRRTRSEVAGAWRSFRYDLGRHPAEPPAEGPDVTSTGMCTFGGQTGLGEPVSRISPAARRPPRRAAAVSAFGLLTVVGAAGAYLAVVNGLGSLLNEQSAAAGTVPPAPAVTSDSRIGGGSAVRRPHSRTLPAPAPTTAGALTPGLARTMVTPQGRPAGPTRTTKAINHDCGCGNPPVPTPTAPASSPSPTPSETASPSVSPAPGESSATPGESPEPGDDVSGRHHRRRHH